MITICCDLTWFHQNRRLKRFNTKTMAQLTLLELIENLLRLRRQIVLGWLFSTSETDKREKTSLLCRLQAQTLPDATPPIGKFHPSIKITVTFEPLMQFRFPSRFRIFETCVTQSILLLEALHLTLKPRRLPKVSRGKKQSQYGHCTKGERVQTLPKSFWSTFFRVLYIGTKCKRGEGKGLAKIIGAI